MPSQLASRHHERVRFFNLVRIGGLFNLVSHFNGYTAIPNHMCSGYPSATLLLWHLSHRKMLTLFLHVFCVNDIIQLLPYILSCKGEIKNYHTVYAVTFMVVDFSNLSSHWQQSLVIGMYKQVSRLAYYTCIRDPKAAF